MQTPSLSHPKVYPILVKLNRDAAGLFTRMEQLREHTSAVIAAELITAVHQMHEARRRLQHAEMLAAEEVKKVDEISVRLNRVLEQAAEDPA